MNFFRCPSDFGGGNPAYGDTVNMVDVNNKTPSTLTKGNHADLKGELAKLAAENLAANGVSNAQVVLGDGALGWKETEPYDVICVSGGLPVTSVRAFTLAVRGFFEANISWIGAVLKEGALSDAPRDDATLIVAALQGALMLAASLDDLAVYDRAAKRVLRFALA